MDDLRDLDVTDQTDVNHSLFVALAIIFVVGQIIGW